MKMTVMYETGDGVFHTTVEQAAMRERTKLLVTVIEELSIGPRPKWPESGVGRDGYFQHEPALVQSYKLRLLKEIEAQCPSVRDLSSFPTYPGNAVERLVPRDNPLHRAWCRLASIDEQGREWSQPYNATHPGSGEDVRINP
jgi:hypothetical protein